MGDAVSTSAIEVPQLHRRMAPVNAVVAVGVEQLQLCADAPRGARSAGKQQRCDGNKQHQSDKRQTGIEHAVELRS